MFQSDAENVNTFERSDLILDRPGGGHCHFFLASLWRMVTGNVDVEASKSIASFLSSWRMDALSK